MQRYSHSGIVPTTGAIQTLLAGVGFATVGGAIYAFAAYWLAGWGPIRFLLMLSYSLVVGVAVAGRSPASTSCHSRSAPLAASRNSACSLLVHS